MSQSTVLSPESRVPSSAGAVRLFVALALPAAARAAVTELQAGLRARLGERGIRWLTAEQLHLTLRFLGDVPAGQVDGLRTALTRAVAGCGSFELALAGLGCFPGARRPRIFWLGCHGEAEEFRALQRGVLAATEPWGQPETREFHPHLTLARLGDHARCDDRRWLELERLYAARQVAAWRVDAVHLMRSELHPAGARYAAVATFALANGFVRE